MGDAWTSLGRENRIDFTGRLWTGRVGKRNDQVGSGRRREKILGEMTRIGRGVF